MNTRTLSKSVPSPKRKHFRTSQTESEDAKWYQHEMGNLLTLYSENQQTEARSLTHSHSHSHSHNHASKPSIDTLQVMSPSLQLDPGYYRKNALTPSNPLFTPRERPSLALALGRPPPRSTVPTDLIDDDIDSLLELYLHTPTTPTSSSFPISPVTDDFGDARNLDGFLFDIPELEVDDEDVDFEPPVTFSLTIPENSLLDGEFSLEESLIGDGVKGGAAHGVWGISNKRRRRVWLKHRKTPAHSLATLGFNPRF